MSRARAPCPNCELPFYTDRNSECPYCGTPVAGPGETTVGGDASGGLLGRLRGLFGQ